MRNGKAPVRIRLRGINTVRRRHADGSEVVHHYFRATGAKLEGLPGSPEFLQSYAAAERAMREHDRGTFADLVRRFEASPDCTKMAETTRLEYRRKLRRIDREWGPCPISGLTDREFRKDVLAWRDPGGRQPGQRDRAGASVCARPRGDRGQYPRQGPPGLPFRSSRQDLAPGSRCFLHQGGVGRNVPSHVGGPTFRPAPG
jgi:hypothetical protein